MTNSTSPNQIYPNWIALLFSWYFICIPWVLFILINWLYIYFGSMEAFASSFHSLIHPAPSVTGPVVASPEEIRELIRYADHTTREIDQIYDSATDLMGYALAHTVILGLYIIIDTTYPKW